MRHSPSRIGHRARRVARALIRRARPGSRQSEVPDTPLSAAARRLGWADDPANRAFLQALGECLRASPGGDVSVLVRRSHRVLDLLAAVHPEATVVPIDVRGGASLMHVRLAAAGPFDLIVDDTRRGPARARLFRRAFLHLRDGGRYLVPARRAGAAADSKTELVGDLVARLVAQREDASFVPARRPERDEAALGAAISSMLVDQDHLVVTRTGTSYAKLNERETNEVLKRREGRSGRVLRTIPGLTLESRCVLRESPSFRAGDMPTTFDVPDLSLREYVDVVCAPGQVALQGHLLLPDTYRHVQRRRLGNRFTEELGPRFARPKAKLANAPRLPGSYYFLDSEFRGHFGHALTEQVSRLWGWAEAKRADPDLKALMAVNFERKELAGFEKQLMAAGGIDVDDIELVTGPVRVDRLVAATPMLGNPLYVHPDILEVWKTVSRHLSEDAPSRDYPRRIFCSRREQVGPGAFRGARRVCRNAEELEALFVRHGFEVIYSEDYPLPEQARIFREADVIAGYAGSALFNLIFSETAKHLVLVSSESYTAKNEYVISSALGNRLDVAWCEAELAHQGRWDSRAFNSSFTFDFGREGVFLQDVLAGL
jgi:capsular polysaccharide biosynthesis protein